MRKNKVLNIITGVYDGGMETLVYRIYEYLNSKEKFDLYLVSLVMSKENFLQKKFNSLCKKVFYMDFSNKSLNLRSFFKNLIQLIKLVLILRKNKFDIINSHDFFSSVIARIAVIICFFTFYKPKRMYVTLHNQFFWLSKKHHFVNKVLSFVTTKLICVSESVKDYSVVHDKVDESKYVIAFNGIDTDRFSGDVKENNSLREKFGYREDDMVIGNIGSFSVRKGQIFLVKSFSKLSARFPNIKLVIAGSVVKHEMDIYEEIENFIKKESLQEKIKIFKPNDTVEEFYKLFNIYVMSSITEGLSLAALEAMSSANVCLFSDIDSFKELVVENETGFFFRSKDVDSLTNKLAYILENYESIKVMGVNARKVVLNKFDQRIMFSIYENLYTVHL